uniref:Uncharacterized protein n=1 Tax=Caenorhabditis japonica TaxID=281687 RepID=A0A8R1DS38_CAEJA
MAKRIASIDDTLRGIETRIQTEVERRLTEEIAALITGNSLRNMVEQRIAEALSSPTCAEPSGSASSESSESELERESSSSCSERDTEAESETSFSTATSSSRSSSSTSTRSTTEESESSEPSTSEETEAEPEEESEPEPEEADLEVETELDPEPFYIPNKWEFLSTFNPDNVTDFHLDLFTGTVQTALNLPADTELFPRMSLEEIIERDHPTTSNLADEKLITCRNRPHGKELTDEEFFCLAPCCSASRLFQAASCPFLPSFVKKRLVVADPPAIMVQTRETGIELITPYRYPVASTSLPPRAPEVPEPEPEEEEEEEEDPLANREIVEQLMHEYFLPTPAIPDDEIIFGPYLRKVRESEEDVPEDLLRALARRVNSNLDNSYKSHLELELFAELDKVEVDEKYGRLPFNPLNNC